MCFVVHARTCVCLYVCREEYLTHVIDAVKCDATRVLGQSGSREKRAHMCVVVCVCVRLCVCVCVPSVLTRLLESDKKADWTRLKYEYRAGERERKEKRAKRRGKEWRT